MKNKIFTLFIFMNISITGMLSAQIDPQFTRDSIEIERGIPGTTDFEPYFKVINEEFDDENRPLTIVVYEYLTPTQLVPLQRQTFQYEGENTANFLMESWDSGAETWIPVKQEISAYDNDLLVSFLRKKAPEGTLVDERRWFYSYDEAGNETERLLQSWNANISSWDNLSRKRATYNDDGNIEVQLVQRFQDGNWNNTQRRIWSWVEGDLQPTMTLAQRWSATDQDWVNLSRRTYDNTPGGLWSGITTQLWDTNTNSWVNEIRQGITINPTNDISTLNLETWDDGWNPSFQNFYSFANNVNNSLLQQWDEQALQYENFLRYRSEFNDSRLPLTKMGMQRWNTDAEAWENRIFTRRINYFWTEVENTSTNEIKVQNRCRIPNPYLPGTPFNCDIPTDHGQLFLEVYNLYGQVMVSEKVAGPMLQINSPLTPGMYIVSVHDGLQVYNLEKIVITH